MAVAILAQGNSLELERAASEYGVLIVNRILCARSEQLHADGDRL